MTAVAAATSANDVTTVIETTSNRSTAVTLTNTANATCHNTQTAAITYIAIIITSSTWSDSPLRLALV
eukprot:2210-Heterococcus_DN1.PRE.7